MEKVIPVPNATIKILSGFVSHIARYKAGRLNSSHFPIPVTIYDPETDIEYQVQLIALVRISDLIPDVFAYLAEGVRASECTAHVMSRSNASSTDQLAYYLYEVLR